MTSLNGERLLLRQLMTAMKTKQGIICHYTTIATGRTIQFQISTYLAAMLPMSP